MKLTTMLRPTSCSPTIMAPGQLRHLLRIE